VYVAHIVQNVASDLIKRSKDNNGFIVIIIRQRATVTWLFHLVGLQHTTSQTR